MFKSLLDYMFNFLKVKIPPSFTNTISKLLAVGHFEVFFAMSNQKSISTTIQNSMVAAAKQYFPTFSMKDMFAWNMKGC